MSLPIGTSTQVSLESVQAALAHWASLPQLTVTHSQTHSARLDNLTVSLPLPRDRGVSHFRTLTEGSSAQTLVSLAAQVATPSAACKCRCSPDRLLPLHITNRSHSPPSLSLRSPSLRPHAVFASAGSPPQRPIPCGPVCASRTADALTMTSACAASPLCPESSAAKTAAPLLRCTPPPGPPAHKPTTPSHVRRRALRPATAAPSPLRFPPAATAAASGEAAEACGPALMERVVSALPDREDADDKENASVSAYNSSSSSRLPLSFSTSASASASPPSLLVLSSSHRTRSPFGSLPSGVAHHSKSECVAFAATARPALLSPRDNHCALFSSSPAKRELARIGSAASSATPLRTHSHSSHSHSHSSHSHSGHSHSHSAIAGETAAVQLPAHSEVTVPLSQTAAAVTPTRSLRLGVVGVGEDSPVGSAARRSGKRSAVQLRVPELLRLLAEGVDLLSSCVPDLPDAPLSLAACDSFFHERSRKRFKKPAVLCPLFPSFGLSPDAEAHVFSFLEPRELMATVPLTARAWHVLARDSEHVWKPLVLARFASAALADQLMASCHPLGFPWRQTAVQCMSLRADFEVLGTRCYGVDSCVSRYRHGCRTRDMVLWC